MDPWTALILSSANGLVVGAMVYTVLSIRTALKWRRIRTYHSYRVGITLAGDPVAPSIKGWYMQASHRGRHRWVARRVVAAFERTVRRGDAGRTLAELALRQAQPNGLEGVL